MTQKVGLLIRVEFEWWGEREKDTKFELSFEEELELKNAILEDLKEISPNREVEVNKIFVKVIE